MTRFELQPTPSRAEKDTATQTGTRDPDVLDCVCRVLSSSRCLHFLSASRSFPSPERIRVFTVPGG